MTRTILAAISGAVLACALILSCSDDSPTEADAQVACDCPSAEPPLAGRIVRVTQTVAIPAQGSAIVNANCSENALLIGGGCRVDQSNPGITLSNSAPEPDPNIEGFFCVWNNPGVANTGIATAICLTPAPAN